MLQLSRILSRKDRLVTEHSTAERESRRALHEYMVTCIDLQCAIRRRQVADAQLELAQVGLLGYDYKPVGSPLDTDTAV